MSGSDRNGEWPLGVGGLEDRVSPDLLPGVAVVIPVHNRRRLVCEAIDSVLSFTAEDVEVIVVDDSSTDGTADEVRERYAGQPVRVVPNDRLHGPAGARNCGIGLSVRRYTALLDSDDCFLPGHLADCTALMAEHGEVDIVFGPARYECAGVEIDYMKPNFDRKIAIAPRTWEDSRSVLLGAAFFEHLIRYGCFFNLSSVVFRTSAISGRMNEQLTMAEDYEFWMRLAMYHRFACMKSAQIVYRVHDGNVSLAGESADDAHSLALIRAYEEVLGYVELPASARRIVHARMAEVLFDWGYHARGSGRHSAAISHHLASFAKGMRVRNLVALVKIGLEMSLANSRDGRG